MKLVEFVLGGRIKVFGIEVPRLFVFFLIMIPVCAYLDFVMFNEFSPQYVPETLEYLSVDVFRQEDGQLVAEADFEYTA